jgi:hypothetical protein
MSMARMAPRSISIPPSLVEWPATLWPPPLTAISRSRWRAVTTARATSMAVSGRTIIARLRS